MSRLLCHLSYTAELVLRSPLTESNRRPSPYHGDALPTELRGREHVLDQAVRARAPGKSTRPIPRKLTGLRHRAQAPHLTLCGLLRIGLGGQPGLQTVVRKRAAEQETLSEVAAHIGEK